MSSCDRPLPLSVMPEAAESDVLLDDEAPSIAGLRVAVPAAVLLIADANLRVQLANVLRSVGLRVGDEHQLGNAVVIITDATRGVANVLADLRARARSDAAIVVVLGSTAAPLETRVAYEAGALLCARVPVDEGQLSATLRAAIDLHSAKVHADDLQRQLDVHAHLASLGRVTANFTHELSNPLAVLAANFEAVSERVGALAPREASGDDLRIAVADMGAAIGRITTILATVRKLARGNRGGGTAVVGLGSLVRDVRRWATRELEGIDVEELVDDGMAAYGDPTLLGQVLMNLVTNAAHAAKTLPSPRIRLHVYASNDTAIVSVRDNGPGIPQEIRDRIFEPFFTTRRGQGGTGLGLALCREYVSQMQGRLTLWTAPGRGSCFRVHLRRGPPSRGLSLA